MIGLLLAAQLTVIVQMEQHQTIEAQGDAIVTNEWRDYVFSIPLEQSQIQSAIRGVSLLDLTISNQVALAANRLLQKNDFKPQEISVVMP